ncbi:hypothetical protein KR222_011474 [Zaprionus bogoriensis]|nr:hypothetical protein KR222_011474 [Zaprionus bogoriensis]
MELISKLKSQQDQITANELIIKQKDEQIVILENTIKSNEIKLNEIAEYKSKIAAHEVHIKKLEQNIAELNVKTKSKDNKRQQNQSDNQIRICIPYGTTRKLMHVPGVEPFEPTLENNIAGPGWVVIQRRFDGTVDFDRDLATYQEGFGDRNGEFWLGLEKMHKITTQRQHELFIHIVDYDGDIHYARYDNFVIGSKAEEYKLKSLGVYLGDAGDMMRMSEKVNFWVCPKYKNGWWDLKKSNPNW